MGLTQASTIRCGVGPSGNRPFRRLERHPALPLPASALTNDVEVFRDAEAEYLAWIARHPQGWVVNSMRVPTPSYLVLHRADCWTIGTQGTGNYTTRDYVKICSVNRAALDSWARCSIDGNLKLCGFCEGRIARALP